MPQLKKKEEEVTGRMEDYALLDNTKSTEEVLDELDQEEYRKDLGQYHLGEDDIVHGVPLLAEFEFDGQIVDTFSFREMNGRDEEAINRAEVRQNGAKIVNVLLERVVVEMGPFTKKELGVQKWGDLIRKCPGGNLDYMMTWVRKVSKGSKYHFRHTCPNCKTAIETEMDVEDYKIIPFDGEPVRHFDLPRKGYCDQRGVYHKSGTIRLPDGYDREIVFPVLKKNKTAGEIAMLVRIISFDDGTPVMAKNLTDMVIKDKDCLLKLMEDMKFGIDSSMELECPQCGYPIESSLGSTDFF